MEISYIANGLARSMDRGELSRDWTGLINGLRRYKRATSGRLKSDEPLASEDPLPVEGKLAIAQKYIWLDFLIAGADLLKKDVKPRSFIDAQCVNDRISEANATGQMLDDISSIANWMTMIDDTTPQDRGHAADFCRDQSDKMVELWANALGEVHGERSRLPNANNLVAAVKSINGYLPQRIESIMRSILIQKI